MIAIRFLSFALITVCCVPLVADDNASDKQAREQKLTDYLDGVKLIGKFTIDGKEDDAKTEAYTISKCEKLPAEDMYQVTARITYGEIDEEVPLKIKILWSGRTPVITLDNFWIPGMGTFGARVLIHSDRYAGTWQHGPVGGHMFGRIEKLDAEATAETDSPTKTSEDQ